MVKALQHQFGGKAFGSPTRARQRSRLPTLTLAAGVTLAGILAIFDLAAFTRVVSYFPGQDPPQGHWVLVRNSVPSFTPAALARMAAIVAAAALVLVGLKSLVRSEQLDAAAEQRGMAVALLSLSVAAATTLLLVASPALYSVLAAEDGIVENLTAATFFGCAMYAAVSGWKYRRSIPRSGLIGLALLAVAFVVFAGEEISWAQRLIGYDTPRAVATRNWQDEMNLHNMYSSSHVNIAFYAGTALLLGLGHWVHRVLAWPAGSLAAFVPGAAAAITVAPSVAMNYPTFNLLAIALPLWLVLGGLLLALGKDEHAPFRSVPAKVVQAAAAVIVVTQLVYLIRGASFLVVSRVGIASEYREFFIALACVAYVLTVVTRLRRESGRRDVAVGATQAA